MFGLKVFEGKTIKLFLLVLIPFLVVVRLVDKRDQPSRFSYEIEKSALQKIFATGGPEKAYSYFKSLDQKYGFNKAHNLGHWVGAYLYKTEGEKGLSFCDEASGYACFHGFFAEALPRGGQDFILRADKVCQEKFESSSGNGGCFHGVGHGLLVVEGYLLATLKAALEGCDKLNSISHAASLCRNGVFMEYNFRSMQNLEDELVMLREFNPENPFEPCEELPNLYQPDCYFEQVAWWAQVLENDFLRIIELCQRLSPGLQESCFRGLGRNLAINTGYNKEKVKNDCAEISSVKMRELCITEAVITSVGDGIADAAELCDSLERKESCYTAVGGVDRSR